VFDGEIIGGQNTLNLATHFGTASNDQDPAHHNTPNSEFNK
jgi:hypothetical protein